MLSSQVRSQTICAQLEKILDEFGKLQKKNPSRDAVPLMKIDSELVDPRKVLK